MIIPVYNEQDTIMPILKKVNEQKIDDVEFEIIVIDDGSTDNSLKILEEHSSLFHELINLESF